MKEKLGVKEFLLDFYGSKVWVKCYFVFIRFFLKKIKFEKFEKQSETSPRYFRPSVLLQ